MTLKIFLPQKEDSEEQASEDQGTMYIYVKKTKCYTRESVSLSSIYTMHFLSSMQNS